MSARHIYTSTLNNNKLGTTKNSGDLTVSPKRISHSIGNYEISILLDGAGRFIGVESVRVSKSFYDPKRLPIATGRSVEEIVDDFFSTVEE